MSYTHAAICFSLCWLCTACSEALNTQTNANTLNANASHFTNPAPIISELHSNLELDLSSYFISNSANELSYAVQNGAVPGMSQLADSYTGTPSESGVYELIISARSATGQLSTGSLVLVIEAHEDELPLPILPSSLENYEALVENLPAHFTQTLTDFGNVSNTDNTPDDNQIDNATATLGRVLFYDKRLSANNTISCASCHQQEHGFSDPRPLSLGFKGEATDRHSPGLSNNAFYQRGHYFWDERADTLEAQVLLPIQSPVEMGMELDALVSKLEDSVFYADLFTDAFGSEHISEERIARALAQFVRSLLSYDAAFDQAFDASANPNFAALSASERRGLQLFSGNAGIPGRNLRCDQCHSTVAHVSDTTHNIGLDSTNTLDDGAGNGRFKAPSLRNVGLRTAFMHDGRFRSLREVILHYSNGIQNNPALDGRLIRRGRPLRLNLNNTEINDLIAFLESLTDSNSTERSLHQDPFSSDSTGLLEIAN